MLLFARAAKSVGINERREHGDKARERHRWKREGKREKGRREREKGGRKVMKDRRGRERREGRTDRKGWLDREKSSATFIFLFTKICFNVIAIFILYLLIDFQAYAHFLL